VLGGGGKDAVLRAAWYNARVTLQERWFYGGVMQSACRQENFHTLVPLRQGSAVIQTTNFRDRPRAAPGMGFRGFQASRPL
jgi:hypothetical protein